VLYRVEGDRLEQVAQTLTNSDGRCDAPLLQGEDYRSGVYQLHFRAGDYYRAKGVKLGSQPFLDEVVLRFGIDQGQDHYHVPLLISPYSYSTYRGS
jgi:5-hydroxyisourate hydrolase